MAAQTIHAEQEIFVSPSFGSRLKSMLKLDFYRLFHTPLLYIMLLAAALIAALILSMSGMETVSPNGVVQKSIELTNTWQIVESTGGSAVADNPLDFAGFANINMIYIFAGLLMAIFVAHDYSSGFVKNIFAVHSKKIDYVISKTVIGVVSGTGMILTYVLGAVFAGMLTGKSFDVNMSGLVMCLISKACLMGIFCALFLGIAVFFRNKLWMTIIFTFLFGMMLYPAASVATLSSTVVTVLLTLVAGLVGAAAIGMVSSFFLNKRDLV